MRSATRRFLCLWLCSCSAACGSGEADPGQLRLKVIASKDPVLSPLADPRVTALELRDAKDSVLSSARFDGPMAARGMLDLKDLPVQRKGPLRLLALGPGGQQVLGMAYTRDVEVVYGEKKEYEFHLRRPLFFFGANQKLLSPKPIPGGQEYLSPGRQIFEVLRDEKLLRVVDPNSAGPLLPAKYDTRSPPDSPIVASAGTYDGRWLLAVTLKGALQVIDTLDMHLGQSVSVPAPQVQALVVSPKDDAAILLHYDTGKAGGAKITFVRDLQALHGQETGAGSLLTIDAAADQGPPLAAAYEPGGLVDVVFGHHPVAPERPDCGSAGKSLLRRYDPKTGMEAGAATQLAYTTSIAFTGAGARVLAQPCGTAPGGRRPGQVLIQQPQGDSYATVKALPAPGTADLGFIKGQAVVAVGRDDVMDNMDGTTVAHGAVRVLEEGKLDWNTPSSFALGSWLVPIFVRFIPGVGPLPGEEDIVLAPRDVLVYRTVLTPDRARALVLMRVTYQATNIGVGLDATCSMDWLGYTYDVMLVNLQTGAREQDWMVGIENQSCTSNCLTDCDNGWLKGYKEGYIPTGTGALFGGR